MMVIDDRYSDDWIAIMIDMILRRLGASDPGLNSMTSGFRCMRVDDNWSPESKFDHDRRAGLDFRNG